MKNTLKIIIHFISIFGYICAGIWFALMVEYGTDAIQYTIIGMILSIFVGVSYNILQHEITKIMEDNI